MARERTSSRRQVSQPEWSVVRRHLHLRIDDAAVALNATAKYLRRLCRENGLNYWPGKKIRSMQAMGRTINMEVHLDAPESSARGGGLGGPAAAEVVEENVMVEEDRSVVVNPPVIPNPPPEELTTLNLIDKVGLPSTSE